MQSTAISKTALTEEMKISAICVYDIRKVWLRGNASRIALLSLFPARRTNASVITHSPMSNPSIDTYSVLELE